MHHGRLPWPTPDELSPERRAVYDSIVGGPRGSGSAFALTDPEGRLEGPFNAMLLSPALGVSIQALGAALRYRTSLSDREREIAILTLAATRRSEFEWYAHELVGRRVGLTDEEVEALAACSPASTFTPTERMAQNITRQLVIDRDLGDDEYDEGSRALGLEKLSELVTLVGYYDHLALALTVWRTPLPSGVAPRFERIVLS